MIEQERQYELAREISAIFKEEVNLGIFMSTRLDQVEFKKSTIIIGKNTLSGFENAKSHNTYYKTSSPLDNLAPIAGYLDWDSFRKDDVRSYVKWLREVREKWLMRKQSYILFLENNKYLNPSGGCYFNGIFPSPENGKKYEVSSRDSHRIESEWKKDASRKFVADKPSKFSRYKLFARINHIDKQLDSRVIDTLLSRMDDYYLILIADQSFEKTIPDNYKKYFFSPPYDFESVRSIENQKLLQHNYKILDDSEWLSFRSNSSGQLSGPHEYTFRWNQEGESLEINYTDDQKKGHTEAVFFDNNHLCFRIFNHSHVPRSLDLTKSYDWCVLEGAKSLEQVPFVLGGAYVGISRGEKENFEREVFSGLRLLVNKTRINEMYPGQKGVAKRFAITWFYQNLERLKISLSRRVARNKIFTAKDLQNTLQLSERMLPAIAGNYKAFTWYNKDYIALISLVIEPQDFNYAVHLKYKHDAFKGNGFVLGKYFYAVLNDLNDKDKTLFLIFKLHYSDYTLNEGILSSTEVEGGEPVALRIVVESVVDEVQPDLKMWDQAEKYRSLRERADSFLSSKKSKVDYSSVFYKASMKCFDEGKLKQGIKHLKKACLNGCVLKFEEVVPKIKRGEKQEETFFTKYKDNEDIRDFVINYVSDIDKSYNKKVNSKGKRFEKIKEAIKQHYLHDFGKWYEEVYDETFKDETFIVLPLRLKKTGHGEVIKTEQVIASIQSGNITRANFFGEQWCGKTSLLKFIAYKVLQEGIDQIVVYLRGREQGGSISEEITNYINQIARFGISHSEVNQLIDDNLIVLFIDDNSPDKDDDYKGLRVYTTSLKSQHAAKSQLGFTEYNVEFLEKHDVYEIIEEQYDKSYLPYIQANKVILETSLKPFFLRVILRELRGKVKQKSRHQSIHLTKDLIAACIKRTEHAFKSTHEYGVSKLLEYIAFWMWKKGQDISLEEITSLCKFYSLFGNNLLIQVQNSLAKAVKAGLLVHDEGQHSFSLSIFHAFYLARYLAPQLVLEVEDNHNVESKMKSILHEIYDEKKRSNLDFQTRRLTAIVLFAELKDGLDELHIEERNTICDKFLKTIEAKNPKLAEEIENDSKIYLNQS